MNKPPCPAGISPLDLLLAGGPEAFAPIATTEEPAPVISKEQAQIIAWNKEMDEFQAAACRRYAARPRRNWRNR